MGSGFKYECLRPDPFVYLCDLTTRHGASLLKSFAGATGGLLRDGWCVTGGVYSECRRPLAFLLFKYLKPSGLEPGYRGGIWIAVLLLEEIGITHIL